MTFCQNDGPMDVRRPRRALRPESQEAASLLMPTHCGVRWLATAFVEQASLRLVLVHEFRVMLLFRYLYSSMLVDIILDFGLRRNDELVDVRRPRRALLYGSHHDLPVVFPCLPCFPWLISLSPPPLTAP